MARIKVTHLTYEECAARLDREARAELGISGEEFLRRLDAGEYDCCEHSDLQSTAWLLRGRRGKDASMADEPPLIVTKVPTYIQVSDELAMEYGVIPDTREHKPPSRRNRLRWLLQNVRSAAARRVYRVVAGEDVPDYDDE